MKASAASSPRAARRPEANEFVPPAGVPLGFLAAGGLGMTAFGLAIWFAADRVVLTPTHPGVVAAAHVGVLAFLTIAVLGALHQFSPVVGRRPLRSAGAARASFVGMLLTAWLLPTGFAHGPEWLVPAGGVVGAVTVGVVAWNVSGPLASTQAGLPGWGLRFSVGFLVATVAFGVVYAFNREAAWFPLYSHRILAHAHLGLLGWLGLTYVSVAEKLWPMFLLAHRRSRRSGVIAVSGFAAGVTALAPGLLFAVAPLVWVGGTLVAIGAAGHLTSLASNVRRRRRPLEVLHAFLFVSAAFLVAAIVLAGLAGAASVATTTRTRFVTAEVVALLAWIALAVVGHVHRIVPFIGYRVLRAQGITTGPSGRPLLFGDLTRPVLTRVSLLTAGAGFATVVVGILAGSASAIATGGVGVAVCGAVTTFNLASAPRRVRAAARVAASKEHHGTQRVAQPVAG